LPIAIAVLRAPTFVCEFANAQADQLAGDLWFGDTGGLAGRSLADIETLITDQDARRTIRDVLAAGQPATFHGVRCPQVRGESLPARYLDLSCHPLPGSPANQVRMLVTAFDVTALAYANQAKDESIGVVVHELRNFLAPILNAVRLM
jgi:hypothetical protein